VWWLVCQYYLAGLCVKQSTLLELWETTHGTIIGFLCDEEEELYYFDRNRILFFGYNSECYLKREAAKLDGFGGGIGIYTTMQNHLDASQRSFSAMLGGDPFGPPSHDFTTLTNHNHHSPEFGHLLNSNGAGGGGGGTGPPPPMNHHGGHNNNNNNNTPNHNNNSSSNNNNNSSGGGEGGKPKKAPPPNGKKTKGRVKIKMEFIDNKLRRYTTFSKRKTGIMKKVRFILHPVRLCIFQSNCLFFIYY